MPYTSIHSNLNALRSFQIQRALYSSGVAPLSGKSEEIAWSPHRALELKLEHVAMFRILAAKCVWIYDDL